MMMKTLRIQPVKTLLTALFIVVGIVTIANYQKLEVVSLDGVLGLLQNAEYATVLLNLMSLLGLAIMAFVWIRPTFKRNWQYEYPEGEKWVNIVLGILLALFSLIFIFYLLQKMAGLLIIGLLIVFIFGGSDHRRQGSYY